jgi:ceramide glucosyltransferase
MEIARRVREQGGAVVAVPLVARSLAAGRSWEVVVGRFARWLTVIRAQRAFLLLSYPALFFATLPIVLVSVLLAFVTPTAAVVSAFLALTARLGVAWLAASIAGRQRGPLQLVQDVALADGMLAVAFVRALGTRTVTWRDRVLVVDQTGLLHEPSALKS